MDKKYGQNDRRIADYVEDLFRPEDTILAQVREHQDSNGLPPIQVGGMDVRHLEVLTRMIGAKKAVEIGTLGGYSGVSIARGLLPGGHLYTFEYDPKHAKIAKESFQKAGIVDRVEIHVGPALENLPKIEKHAPFDLVFIDADKVNYPNYLGWAAANLRVGGVVLGDNAFAFGHIANDDVPDEDTRKAVKALRNFNETLARGGQFRSTMIPTGEGLALGVKIG